MDVPDMSAKGAASPAIAGTVEMMPLPLLQHEWSLARFAVSQVPPGPFPDPSRPQRTASFSCAHRFLEKASRAAAVYWQRKCCYASG
jgi:hypothetical protein